MNKNRKFSDDLLPPKSILKHLEISPNAHIIDAACGSGYMAKAFSSLSKDNQVYALDIDAMFIGYLEQECIGTNIEPLVSDITKMTPFEDSSIDILYISNAYHIFDSGQEKSFNKEVNRILKPNAKLVVVNLKKESMHFGPDIAVKVSPEELKEKISLKPKELIELEEHFYMYIFEK